VVFVAVVWGMNRFIPSISDVYPAGEALPKSLNPSKGFSSSAALRRRDTHR
jgi:hypothetical protein